jgi:hypothetical protein
MISTNISIDFVNNSKQIKTLSLILFEKSSRFINSMVKELYPPIDNLQITSGGKLIGAQLYEQFHESKSPPDKKYERNELHRDSLRPGVLKFMEITQNIPPQIVFWKFNISFSPNEKKTVIIHFIQMLYYHKSNEDSTTVCYYYPFPINRIWGKTIKNIQIDFKYHWDISAGIIHKSSIPHCQNDTAMHWTYGELDTSEEVLIEMKFPNKWIEQVSSGEAPYDLNALSNVLVLKDRIIRFNRDKKFSVEKWVTLIEILLHNSSNDMDTELNRTSRKFLSDFRLHLIRNWWENPEINIEDRVVYHFTDIDQIRNRTLEKIIANNHHLWPNDTLNINPVLAKRYKKVKSCLKWLTPQGILIPENVSTNAISDKWIATHDDGLQRFENYSYYLESPLLAGRLYLLAISNMLHFKRMKTLFLIGFFLLLSGVLSYIYVYHKRM